MKKSLFVVLCAMATTACAEQTSPQKTSVQTVQANEQGIWIDVRTADEYNNGHLPQAVNITHTQIAEQISKITPDKNQAIHLYCQSGRRAEIARNVLLEMGYSNVTNHGGYADVLKNQAK